jgi:hypothetical protein
MTIVRRFLLVVLLTLSASAFAAGQSFDLVIVNGHIVDGTGSPW